jgi:two-component system response regulator YesN
MYKMLIVDDEPRQLRALSNIIRGLRPNYEIYETFDGKMALEVLDEYDADIIITDIRMPVMDGMQLIEELSARKHHAKVILLTGHGEFDYAQKAIKLGVFDYIVKPVGKSVLEQLLQKLDDSLEQQMNVQKEKETMEKKLDEFLSVYQVYVLNKWIHGQINHEEQSELEKIITKSGLGTIGIIEVKSNTSTKTICTSKISKALTDLIQIGTFTCFVLDGDPTEIVFYLNIIPTIQKNTMLNLNLVLDRLNDWIAAAKMENEVNISIGMVALSNDVFQKANLYFNQAQSALNRKFFEGSGKVIVYEPVKYDKSICLDILEEETHLLAAMKKFDIGTVNETVNALFERVSTHVHLPSVYIKNDCVHLLIRLAQMIKHLVTEANFSTLVSRIRNELTSSEDYKMMRHKTKNMLQEIMNHYQDQEKNSKGMAAQLCQKYIEDNYTEDISLEFLSTKFHFNASYFSTLFKCHTGISLSDYVLKVRMQKARELLLHSNDNMTEVAQKVGYKEASYFIRMFKREWGISPHKFRHGLNKE